MRLVGVPGDLLLINSGLGLDDVEVVVAQHFIFSYVVFGGQQVIRFRSSSRVVKDRRVIR